MGVMNREIKMLKEQVELLLKGHDTRTKVEDEFVEWEQGQVLTPPEVPMVSEVIPELPVEDDMKDLKLADMERHTIRQALVKNGGNRKAASVELGLSERTLYRKIKEYGL